MKLLLLLASLVRGLHVEDIDSMGISKTISTLNPVTQISGSSAESPEISAQSSDNEFILRSVHSQQGSSFHENVFQYKTSDSKSQYSNTISCADNKNEASDATMTTGMVQNSPESIVDKTDFGVSQKNENNFNSSEGGDQSSIIENSSEAGRFMSFEEWKKHKKLELEANLAGSEVSSALRSSQAQLETEKNKVGESTAIANGSLLHIEEQGKTYKDKFNYASVNCAATVVKTNSDAKGASAILTEVKDSYLINQCSTTNKFIVVELCQDVLISSIVMGNFELFSSMFRMVRFSVSDRFPASDGWHKLGEFEAQNRRDEQSFSIENPLIWSRYLKIDILSHYGNEFYCPLSILRVHGTNMMEDYKNTESTNKVESGMSLPTEEFLNYTVDFDEECKALSPYLAMNEFLKVFNNSSDFCGIRTNSSVTSIGTTTTKVTQDSIFQNIIKRLSLLESNATLSLLYVEEQSKLLSDAFISLEGRQVKKFENLLMQFNDTIHSQVQFLDSSLQKINEESQKVLQTSRVFTSGAVQRIKLETKALVSELSFFKKLVVIDTVIILSLLAYVVFRETVVTEDLFKKETAAASKRLPIRAFPVSKRKTKTKTKKSF